MVKRQLNAHDWFVNGKNSSGKHVSVKKTAKAAGSKLSLAQKKVIFGVIGGIVLVGLIILLFNALQGPLAGKAYGQGFPTTQISQCATITSPGVYEVRDIDSADFLAREQDDRACIVITSDDVTVRCTDPDLVGPGFDVNNFGGTLIQTAIEVRNVNRGLDLSNPQITVEGVKIEGCEISRFINGLIIRDSQGVVVDGNTFGNVFTGINLVGSSYNIVSKNEVTTVTGGLGLFLSSNGQTGVGSNNNIIDRNTISGAAVGLTIRSGSDDNSLVENDLTGNTRPINDFGQGNTIITSNTGGLGEPCNAGNSCDTDNLDCIGGTCLATGASSCPVSNCYFNSVQFPASQSCVVNGQIFVNNPSYLCDNAIFRECLENAAGTIIRENLCQAQSDGTYRWIATSSIPGLNCGNGLLGEEDCDDGNNNNGDGCSSECVVENGFTCTGEVGGISLCQTASSGTAYTCRSVLSDGSPEGNQGSGTPGNIPANAVGFNTLVRSEVTQLHLASNLDTPVRVSYAEYCNSAGRLVENYCRADSGSYQSHDQAFTGLLGQQTVNCGAGYSCQNGACVSSPAPSNAATYSFLLEVIRGVLGQNPARSGCTVDHIISNIEAVINVRERVVC